MIKYTPGDLLIFNEPDRNIKGLLKVSSEKVDGYLCQYYLEVIFHSNMKKGEVCCLTEDKYITKVTSDIAKILYD